MSSALALIQTQNLLEHFLKNNSSYFMLIFFLAVTAFCAGRWTQGSQLSTLELASETEPAALNSYDHLPCPSEAIFQKMAEDFKLVLEDPISLDETCDNRPKAQLAKVFLLMTTLKPSPPQNWPTQLRQDINDTYAYLKNNVSKLTLDLNQKDSLAYNKVTLKEIYLSKRFFDLPPLDGIAVLFHEARHSSSFDKGHTFCSSGDLPRTEGACDQRFSLEQEDAGAYSYGTLFSLSLSFYTNGLAESDKQFTLLDAITQLGARFNEMPPALAQKMDVLAVLDRDGKLSLIHPFINAKEDVPLTFSNSSEKAERIEFSTNMNGVMIFTNQGHVYTWNPRKGLAPLYPELIKDRRVIALNRVRVPFNQTTYFTLIDDDQNIQYIEYSPAENRRVLSNFVRPFFRAPSPMPVLKNLILGLFGETIFLAEDGKAYFAPHYASEDLFKDIQTINVAQNQYVAGTGGAVYDSLYLIEKRGTLHNVHMELNETQNESDPPYNYNLLDSEYKSSNGLIKFQQGLNINAAMNNKKQILIWNKDSFESKTLDLQKVKDFILIQNAGTKSYVAKTANSLSGFATNCRVKTEFDDLWLGWGVGETQKNELVFANKGSSGASTCVTVPDVQFNQLTPYYDSILAK